MPTSLTNSVRKRVRVHRPQAMGRTQSDTAAEEGDRKIEVEELKENVAALPQFPVNRPAFRRADLWGSEAMRDGSDPLGPYTPRPL